MTTMTRADFNLIAEGIEIAIKRCEVYNVPLSDEQKIFIAQGMCLVLVDTNPNFNPSRFVEAATKLKEK